MNTDNIKQQMRKGVLELCVLSIIAAHSEVYPADIKKRLESAGMDIVEGTLYPMLTRLKNSGHLTYEFKESGLGPPRKYYRMTDEGRAFLTELQQSWRDFVGSVNMLFQPEEESTATLTDLTT
ncbi:MAG: PadR family transcriptional regulator [Saprospiraceae bacterium]|nr:PadR family transcriptional regulator [Saprospiraceae bacterium]